MMDNNVSFSCSFSVRNRLKILITIQLIPIFFLSLIPSASANTPPVATDDTVRIHMNTPMAIDVLDNDTDVDATINRYVASFNGDEEIIWPNLGLDHATTLSKFIKFRSTDPGTESGGYTVLFDVEFVDRFDGGFILNRGNLVLRCGFHSPNGVQVIDDIASFADWADGEWHSVGFTYDGSTLRTYFDGVEAGTPISIAGEIRYNYSSVCGRRTNSNSKHFTGELYDFAVYNIALTPSDILDYHQGTVPTANVVLWGQLGESTGGSYADSSGNGNNSTNSDAIPLFTDVQLLDEIDRSTVTIVQNASSGNAVAYADGTITYTPSTNFTGTDQFQYTVMDKAAAASNSATVTITVNSPPLAGDDTTSTPINVPVLLNLVANDSDPDGTLGRYIGTFDGNDRMTWTNLNLDGTAAISKFIRFRTMDTNGVLFDFEVNPTWDGGISSIDDFLKLRLGLYGAPPLIQVSDIAEFPVYGDGQWHSTGFTYDGTTVRGYFDGVESGTPVGSLNGQTVKHNYTTNLGRRTVSSGIFITGDFYDFVVYDVALTPAEVLDYHHGVIKPQNQVLWGRMDESDYTKGLLDWSGNNYHGTSYGATPVLDTTRFEIGIVDSPDNGSVRNHLDGTVTYTPNTGYTGTDSFTYTLNDSFGATSAFATVTIVVADPMNPPVITVFSPANGAIINEFNVTIQGTVVDDNLSTFTINGEAVPVVSDSFLHTLPLLTEGNNSVTLVATDASSNTTTETLTVVRDTSGLTGIPQPAVIVPTTNTNATTITLTGVALPSTTIQVDGGASQVTTTTDASGNFSIDVPLNTNRINQLFLTNIDGSDSSDPLSIEIIQDTQPPFVFIDFPEDGSELTNESIVVAGRVSDLLSGFMGLNVTVNGIAAEVIVGIGTNGTFEASDVPLTTGSNTITATATDIHGNTTMHTVTVEKIDIPTGSPAMVALAGDLQTAQVNTELSDPIVVRVTQGDGSPFANKLVTFDVTRSDGQLAATAGSAGSKMLQLRTDSNGEAAVHWTLGSDAGCGNNRVAVISKDIAGTVYFCASADPAPAAQINVGSGDNQRVAVGGPAPEKLRVWVNDSCNGVGGIPVTYTVKIGFGAVNGAASATVLTSMTGHAEVTFALGPLAGNNVVEANFAGNTGPPAVFTLMGVPADETTPTTFRGLVQDNSGTPIGGAACVLEVSGITLPSVNTTDDGFFEFTTSVPAGPGHLHIDGLVATTRGGNPILPGLFPALSYEILVVENAENSLPTPVLLPELNVNNEVTYDGTQDVTLTVEGIEGLKMTVKAGSMTLADSTVPSPSMPVTITLNEVHHDDIPMPMPDGVAPPFAWTLQPAGATFDPPVEVEYPNMTGLPPGSIAYFLSFNHDTNRFEIVASGSVTDDGTSIVTDPGSGIAVAGWGCNCPPYAVSGDCEGEPTVDPEDPPPCEPDSTTPPSPLSCSTCGGPPGGPSDMPGTSPPGGSDAPGAGTGGGKILIHKGEERYDVTDLTIPGRGLDWTQRRVYRSQRVINSPMGYGWTHPLLDYLEMRLDGTVRAFGGVAPGDTTRSDDWVEDSSNPGSYTAPKGIFSRLTRDDSGTPSDPDDDTFLLVDRDGSKREFGPIIDGRAPLTAIEDKYGNRMKLYYEDTERPLHLTRVNDTLGRDIVYEYYPNDDPNPGRRNRLQRITDFLGRQVNYDYDADGNLIEAVSPAVTGTVTGNNFPTGKKESYTYTSGFPDVRHNHNLLSVVRANENDSNHGLPDDGTPALSWTYDSGDRVTTHTIGALSGSGSGGGTLTYAYDENPTPPADFDPGMEDVATLKVTETDRNNNVRVYWVDDFGTLTRFEHFTSGVRPGDPPKYLKRYKLNSDALNNNVDNPEGDQWVMTYDSVNLDPRQRGNLLAAVHTPGPRGGDQTQIEWKYAYDPFYNQKCLIIDPRAFDSGFIPPVGGTVTPERYATRYFFDYQEGPDDNVHKQRLADKFGLTLAEVDAIIDHNETQIEQLMGWAAGSFSLLGHGDLNGDGRTDQIDGNHVKLIQPTVTLETGSNQAEATGSTAQAVIEAMAWDDHGLKQYDIDPVGNITDYFYFLASNPNGDGDGSEVSDPRGGNGYLSEVRQDDRELSVIPREPGLPFASLQTFYARDTVGNVTSMTDPRGNTWTYVVNELNQVIRTTEPAPYSYSTETIYDANNNVVERRIDNLITDPLDYKPQLDASDNIVMTAGAPSQFIHRYTYDILNNLIEEDLDATGSTPDRLLTQYGYDGNENRTTVTKPESNVVETTYDERDLVYQVTRGFVSSDASTVSYNYDKNKMVVEIIDAQDNNGDGNPESLIYEYDGYDRLRRTIDAVGNVHENVYDPKRNIIEKRFFGVVGGPSPTDNSGTGNVLLSRSNIRYDEINRAYQTDRWLDIVSAPSRTPTLVDGPLSDADGFVSARTEYDAASRVTYTVEDDHDTTEHQYDGINRRIRTIDEENNDIDYTYDENSNIVVTTEIDRSQVGTEPDQTITTTNSYDVLNRLTKTVDHAGNTDRFGYDSRDNQTIHEDAKGNSTLTDYDGANRRIATNTVMRTDGSGGTSIDTSQAHNGFISVFYTWDGNSRLEALTDDNGNRTIYAYDDLDRKLSATYGNVVSPALADVQDPTTSETWTYDRDHNITTFTDQNGSIYTYTHDGLNRKTQCDIAFASGNPHNLTGTTQQTHQYDGLSRKTRCTDNNQPRDTRDDIVCTYAYDTLSRAVEETTQIGSLPARVTSYNFDESLARAGDLDPISMVYPDGREVEYHYDGINRLNQINDTGHSAIVSYDYIGRTPRILQKSHQNNTLQSVVYDAIRRPTRLITEDSAMGMIVGFDHGYDAEDNKVYERKLHNTGNSELYAYDSAYRLTMFDRGTLNAGGTAITTHTTLTGALQIRDWTLDGVGNWSTFDSQRDGEGVLETATRTHTNFNEIAGVSGDVPTATFDNDDNGNLLTDDIYDYQWDALNRLRMVTRVADGLVVATSTYDCQNRRMRKVVTNSGSLDTPVKQLDATSRMNSCEGIS